MKFFVSLIDFVRATISEKFQLQVMQSNRRTYARAIVKLSPTYDSPIEKLLPSSPLDCKKKNNET